MTARSVSELMTDETKKILLHGLSFESVPFASSGKDTSRLIIFPLKHIYFLGTTSCR